LEDYRINLSGFGILKSINKKTLKQTEIAALIISLVYLRRMEMLNHFMTMRE
jgi:hypothetical protein